MNNNRLQVAVVEKEKSSALPLSNQAARRQEIQATMERLWHQNPEQFDPNRDCEQRRRIKKTMETLQKHVPLKGIRAADLGCGEGELSRLIRDAGAKVDAVDIASKALEKLRVHDMRDIVAIQDCLPNTKLIDNSYDLVVCTEVIGYIKPVEYRLLFAELARLVNRDGFVACSTALDLDSDNALERFASLAETEFEIEHWVLSYDHLWLRLCSFFEAPAKFAKGSKNGEFRRQELSKRKSFSRLWFSWNSTLVLGVFWRIVSFAANPIAAAFRQSERLINFLEKITRFLWSETGISHVLFLGKRRPLSFPLPPDEIPKELKHKRQTWE